MGKCSSGQVVVSTKVTVVIQTEGTALPSTDWRDKESLSFSCPGGFRFFFFVHQKASTARIGQFLKRVQKKPSRVKTPPQLSVIAYQRRVHTI